jgi:hypothetical protein
MRINRANPYFQDLPGHGNLSRSHGCLGPGSGGLLVKSWGGGALIQESLHLKLSATVCLVCVHVREVICLFV